MRPGRGRATRRQSSNARTAHPTFNPEHLPFPSQRPLRSDFAEPAAGLEKNRQRQIMAELRRPGSSSIFDCDRSPGIGSMASLQLSGRQFIGRERSLTRRFRSSSLRRCGWPRPCPQCIHRTRIQPENDHECEQPDSNPDPHPGVGRRRRGCGDQVRSGRSGVDGSACCGLRFDNPARGGDGVKVTGC